MNISVSDAKAQLTELVRRAEAGEDIVLTRLGTAVVRLTPLFAKPSAARKRAIMEEIAAWGSAEALPGPNAARSQDFLYGEDGLPA